MSYKHGHTRGGVKTGTYSSWQDMVRRCCAAKSDDYHNYGGRGISVCRRWKLFENFLADMWERPKGMMLDRKNNDGNYEPTNCRWVTRAVQNRNTRQTRFLTFRGKTLCAADWANKLGMPYSTLHGRLRKGWSTERTLTEKT